MLLSSKNLFKYLHIFDISGLSTSTHLGSILTLIKLSAVALGLILIVSLIVSPGTIPFALTSFESFIVPSILPVTVNVCADCLPSTLSPPVKYPKPNAPIGINAHNVAITSLLAFLLLLIFTPLLFIQIPDLLLHYF